MKIRLKILVALCVPASLLLSCVGLEEPIDVNAIIYEENWGADSSDGFVVLGIAGTKPLTCEEDVMDGPTEDASGEDPIDSIVVDTTTTDTLKKVSHEGHAEIAEVVEPFGIILDSSFHTLADLVRGSRFGAYASGSKQLSIVLPTYNNAEVNIEEISDTEVSGTFQLLDGSDAPVGQKTRFRAVKCD